MKPSQRRKIRYKSHMSIGSMAAESDDLFLQSCFIKTDDFETITNFNSPKCILLGRTGTGKSAAIIRINSDFDNVISVDPQTLALNYISNSDVLRFFSNLGVKLDIFYRLLWQHVFCVELLQYHFKLRNENEMARFKDWLKGLANKDASTKVAAAYLDKWNAKFWLEREKRIKEITETLERNIVAGAGLEQHGIKANISAEHGMSQEVKSEIIQNAQKVVNEIQIQHLSQVIDVISKEIFNDKQRKVYITIDGLDDDWVEDDLRYKLIRALIEATKKFRRIANVKIIIALRADLLDRVYKMTRDSGFQEEKYEDLNLRISWKKGQIKEILDARINQLFKDQYTGETLDFYDIFPDRIKSDQPTLDFLVNRTLMRPRDAIAFVNTVLDQVSGTDLITSKAVLDAERSYSERRLKAVLQEWIAEYPRLEEVLILLKDKPTTFTGADLSNKELEDFIVRLIASEKTEDQLERLARKQFGSDINLEEFRRELLKVLFRVGFIGAKEHATNPYVFSYSGNVNEPHFGLSTKIQIHTMFWLALGNRKLRGGVFDTESDAA